MQLYRSTIRNVVELQPWHCTNLSDSTLSRRRSYTYSARGDSPCACCCRYCDTSTIDLRMQSIQAGLQVNTPLQQPALLQQSTDPGSTHHQRGVPAVDWVCSCRRCGRGGYHSGGSAVGLQYNSRSHAQYRIIRHNITSTARSHMLSSSAETLP